MKIKLALLASLVLLAGCDKVVSTERVSEPVVTEQTVSCRHAGYCFTCVPSFDGKTGCGFRWSTLCPGERLATVRITDYVRTYESGKKWSFSDTEVVEHLTACE